MDNIDWKTYEENTENSRISEETKRDAERYLESARDRESLNNNN